MYLFIILLSLMLPSFALAADQNEDQGIIDIPPGPDNIVVLNQGEKAPFTGQLFDNDTAFRWGGWLMQYKLRLKTDVELEHKLCDADKKLLETQLRLQTEKQDEVLGLYDAELDNKDEKITKLEHPPFFRTAWFGFTAGVAVTAIGVLVAALSL